MNSSDQNNSSQMSLLNDEDKDQIQSKIKDKSAVLLNDVIDELYEGLTQLAKDFLDDIFNGGKRRADGSNQ